MYTFLNFEKTACMKMHYLQLIGLAKPIEIAAWHFRKNYGGSILSYCTNEFL